MCAVVVFGTFMSVFPWSASATRSVASAHGPTGIAAEHLGHAGRWLTDEVGRVLIIHGVNMPSKLLPATAQSLNFGDDDAALLARLGFNAVRLTVERYAVEPHPGQFDDAYVSQFAETVRMLAGHGILSLIDFHQDEYGPAFLDNGYPDWMTNTDGINPLVVYAPFPLQYVVSPSQNRAWDNLWANAPDVRTSGTPQPLQSDDAELLAHVAAGLKDEPGLLGYEIINEPWPGLQYPICYSLAGDGCPDFDKGPVSDYYKTIVPAIRAADPTHMIWYEPLSSFNQGNPTFIDSPNDPDLGFAFHDYPLCGSAVDDSVPDPRCVEQDVAVQENAVARSAATGEPLLETEFGATMHLPTITRLLNLYDQYTMPWMWWSYTRYMVKLDANSKLLDASDANVNWPLVDALTRPYPQLVSGTPVSWSFDPATKTFNMRYSTARADGNGSFPTGSVTEIHVDAVPARLYPNGYGITVEGGMVLSSPGADVLKVASCDGSSGVTITISVTPGQHTSC